MCFFGLNIRRGCLEFWDLVVPGVVALFQFLLFFHACLVYGLGVWELDAGLELEE